jgi:pimeloyl-ACP methyl ester carboxylesterase
MPARKTLPEPTIKNLIPPRDDYRYFEDPRGNPFRPAAADFALVNAGWLIDAALLAYGDEAFIRARVAALPGARVRFFEGATTQAFALETDAFALVAFRGTRVEQFPDFATLLRQALPGNPVLAGVPPGAVAFSNWRDLVTDGQFALGPDGVHTGFRQALDQVWGDVEAYLDGLGGKPVWLTGHSLGAALATLAASRRPPSRRAQGLYTFGSPRVGNAAFAATVPGPCYRFVNNNDVVTRLPPPGLFADYTHVGVLKYIRTDGVIVEDPAPEDVARDRLAGWLETLGRFVGPGALPPAEFLKELRALNVVIPDDGLNDHAPVNYACRVWNAV